MRARKKKHLKAASKGMLKALRRGGKHRGRKGLHKGMSRHHSRSTKRR